MAVLVVSPYQKFRRINMMKVSPEVTVIAKEAADSIKNLLLLDNEFGTQILEQVCAAAAGLLLTESQCLPVWTDRNLTPIRLVLKI